MSGIEENNVDERQEPINLDLDFCSYCKYLEDFNDSKCSACIRGTINWMLDTVDYVDNHSYWDEV